MDPRPGRFSFSVSGFRSCFCLRAFFCSDMSTKSPIGQARVLHHLEAGNLGFRV